jgi:hypothetical protein
MSNKKIVFHFKVDYNDRERAKQCKLRWNPDIKTAMMNIWLRMI